MRILVSEFASGGGFAGRPIPAALAREGRAMLTALLADLVALGRHEVVTTNDSRFGLNAPDGVEIVPIRPGGALLSADLLAKVDAVWLIAPETSGCLEQLAATVEREGKALLGTGSRAIRRAADKRRLPDRLARVGIRHPSTRVVRPGDDVRSIAADLDYPMVVKPGRGAGCDGVRLARNQRELRAAIEGLTGRGGRSCRTQTADDGVLVQQYIRGMAASVSLISNGRRVVPLSINAQTIRRGRAFSYRGGCTPLDHPLAARGIAAAIRACETLRNLRGYIGVDLVLTGTDAVVIEVNPRLTTAYLGVRAAVRRSNGAGNIAGLAIEACEGAVPARPVMQHRVRFTSAGRIAMSS